MGNRGKKGKEKNRLRKLDNHQWIKDRRSRSARLPKDSPFDCLTISLSQDFNAGSHQACTNTREGQGSEVAGCGRLLPYCLAACLPVCPFAQFPEFCPIASDADRKVRSAQRQLIRSGVSNMLLLVQGSNLPLSRTG